MRTPVVVFHPGVQHSWQTATALQDLGRLAYYATSIFYRPNTWPYRIERYLPGRMRARVSAEFGRFHHPGLDPDLVRTVGLEEWVERIANRAGLRTFANRVNAVGNRKFARRLARTASGPDDFALWGYDGSSLVAFRAAKRAGRTCILDRTIGDPRALNRTMARLCAEWPQYAPDYYALVGERQIEAEDEEHSLADVILTGSEFAAETVRSETAYPDVPGRVRVLNYCYDERLFAGLPPPRLTPRDRPLRFLFLGQAGVRKGIHLVLRVFDRIPRSAATLTIVGDLQVPDRTWRMHADRVHHRPTIARAEVPAELANHDILLFPSFFEGAGLVLYEALAAGTALIQSREAALAVTPDTGILLSRNDEENLYEAVMTAIEDRARVVDWRTNAQAVATRYSFDRYRDSIADLLASTLDEPRV